MTPNQQMNYARIADAITYIRQHFQGQPTLEEIAATVHISPYHFQRLFTEWAGVSPKKFLQYISVEHAKQLLRHTNATVYDAAFETGLSGTGRLHDLFVTIEGMTPGEYKNGGEALYINYCFAESPFGTILVASTPKGICSLSFADDEAAAYRALCAMFPKSSLQQSSDSFHHDVLSVFTGDWQNLQQIRLHLKATAFQLKVWEALLKIPMGRLSNYGAIAQTIQQPTASRAVGTAIGSNPVAFLIPCHRVIQANGMFGGYMWGETRKTAMIGWEAAKTAV